MPGDLVAHLEGALGGDMLAYTTTTVNQVDTVTLGGNPLLEYDYDGRMLRTRMTITSVPGGTTAYEQEWAYDVHRRVEGLTNRLHTCPQGRT